MGSNKASSSSSASRSERLQCFRDICILVVDFDHICLRAVSGMLRALTYEVVMADRAMEALAIIQDKDCIVDMVLMELYMPDMYGLDLLDEIKRISDMPVLVMSYDGNENVMLRSLQKGAEFYFRKPLIMEDVTDIWQYVHTRRRPEQRLGAEKKNDSAAVEESFEEEEGIYGDEGSAVCDRNNSYGDEEDPGEEDTLTSPLPKKARLDAGSSSSGTEAGGSCLFADPVEEEQIIPPPPPQPWAAAPPPPPTPPRGQGMVKTSDAEPEGDDEAAAKGGDTN